MRVKRVNERERVKEREIERIKRIGWGERGCGWWCEGKWVCDWWIERVRWSGMEEESDVEWVE